MTSLRRVEGIDLGFVAERFGAEHRARIETAAKEWVKAGVLVAQGDRLAIRPECFLVSDAVIEAFFA